ncbi:putative transmembrane sensor domain protein [Nostoc sp. PCC 7524]|uniref:CHASE2 domain-containing serine/threonine-protein kinase n=1 Tax=Nostoc sp. (strain ATCC 29411 / PCC 7524) TaxID=28072 RepID=UPI00029ED3B1|nr:CHASE2 domain-containing serine/threonine-protein kinase [Nostoc sp. PCC 7524]AFY47465.1 putative transmembrane sensor domain protein [Nostoc sp. PCC 7524]
MAEEPPSTSKKKYVSTANIASSKQTNATLTASVRQSQRMVGLGKLLAIASAIAAALLTSSGVAVTQWLENQALSTFFYLRGPLVPPEDIVILAIDDQSISVPEQYYKTDPQKYAYLEPLRAFPFKRAAYAQVIAKLMQAGARAVALDVVFDTPGSYGAEDDRQLQAALQKYGSKVILAAQYETFESHQGAFTQLRLPYEKFREHPVAIGTVNFPLEVDGKVHRLASEFSKLLAAAGVFTDKAPSFDQAVLGAAQVKYPQPQGDRIYFWGPAGTFEPIPLWYVLDPENWNTYLQQGKVFRDKIVIVGATAQLGNDYHRVPVGRNWLYPEQMSGVEIHANAIATVMTGKAIAPAINSPFLRGLFVLGLVGGTSLIISKSKSGLKRFLWSITVASVWGGISYISFIYGKLVLPTSVPILAIAFTGASYLGTEVAREKIRTRQLVDIFQKYKTSPVVQEIISQQQDLQELLQQRDVAVAGKILGGRYKIAKVLGSGGFSETYIAEDMQRPGNPRCVVKQLKPANTQAKGLELARRLFASEAQTLEKLGTHPQIPQLLAYFEQEAEFYLVQEYIIGHPLSRELPSGKGISETTVIKIVKQLLQILVFVHENSVIHRDIKPSNIIRRHSDHKLVLIDFGAVKEISAPQLENQEQIPFTIGIGTKGYAPSEQCFGRPQYSSDIYAVGMIGIKALTGMAPHEIPRDSQAELKWIEKAFVSEAFAQILSKMVRDDYKQRYQSALAALAAIDNLDNSTEGNSLPQTDPSMKTSESLDDSDLPTAPWPKNF